MPLSLPPSDTGSLKLGQGMYGDDDDAGSTIVPAAAPLVPLHPVYEGPLPTPPQKAFQAGSTPAHLTHRFMVGHTGRTITYMQEDTVGICVKCKSWC